MSHEPQVQMGTEDDRSDIRNRVWTSQMRRTVRPGMSLVTAAMMVSRVSGRWFVDAGHGGTLRGDQRQQRDDG